MIIQSKYTKIFHSNGLTHKKYDELHDFALLIQNHKNTVSQYINDNLLRFLEYNKFQFLKEMREHFKDVIPSSFDSQLYTQVFTCYQNKFDAIQHKLVFEVVTFKGFEFYKRDTKKHKKGDLKKVVVDKKQTHLSNCLTYLAKYGNENTLDYINDKIKKCDEKKREFYNNILRCCEKYGFERLLNLALSKRKHIVKHYSEYPIEFKSLTFSGRCRKTRIIDYNSKFGSVINSFVSLSGIGRKSFDIPVTFNKGWHGNMKDYGKKKPDYEYTLTFNEKKHQVNIHLCKDGERYIPQANGNTVGIDVNCKHNLFSLSDETTYDYDRKLANDFCKLSLEIDKLKEKDKEYKVGKRKQQKLDTLKSKMIKSEQQLIANMCKTLHSQGVGHIVMEDLDNGFGQCYVKDKDNGGINYNRKVKFLGLSSLKQEVEHIARKYDIAVSTVQASYTSKMCPICGCIEDENRPNQETFECIECGHKDNADFNAAKNIRNRVLVTVLREILLKKLDNGAFEPKKIKREKVKEVLLSFRRSLAKQGSECIKSSVTTFDYVKSFGRKKLTTEEFVIKSNERHGGKYDYSNTEYIDNKTPVVIICPDHGEFIQVPSEHLRGCGCPECGNCNRGSKKRMTTEEFIERSVEKHGNKYGYGNVRYINSTTPVTITCPDHGDFLQLPPAHLRGQGCPKCSGKGITKEELIKRFREVHGERYDYSEVKFTKMGDKVKIICRDHGEFLQTPSKHLSGQDCPKCAHFKNRNNITLEEFVERSRKIHGNTYDYKDIKFNNLHDKVEIVCDKHGTFRQNAYDHLNGHGCPSCGVIVSNNENEIYNILCSKLGCENVEQHNRTILNGKEIDIYIPSMKIGIEYNGLLWHSQFHQKDRTYHLNKLVECNRQGIKLIQVFEDEYVRNKELVIAKILHILGISDNLPKIGARKCLIRNITKKQCESFMNSNHIQGFSSGSVYLGAFFNDQLIGSMIFRRISGDSWELVRFATHNGYICQGLGGKIFKYFVKAYNPKTVKSFADRRWTTDQYDNIYTKLGFSLEKTLKPEYRYYRPSDGPVRHHKFAFRKNILHRKYGLPLSLSETQMTEQLGYTKVFDCGMFKYVWKSQLQ